MGENAITVDGLSKLYRIGTAHQVHDTLRDHVTDAIKSLYSRGGRETEPAGHLWALKDVSFEIKTGEVVGLIGRNGAGKSTALKILSRITEPTRGYAEISGRVGSLLEVGTGFHGELTGRENIFLNGAILGMKRTEIKRKFDEIVSFAEVEKFVETPVKRYSSGLYMRLAFAVAAHLETEILLIDEVLAVGDTAFQNKCLGKMGDIGRQGRTILFVTHNLAALEHLCSKAILLDAGRVILQDETNKVIHYYLEKAMTGAAQPVKILDRLDRSGSGIVRLTDFHIEDAEGSVLSAVRSGMDVVLVFSYECADPERARNVDVGFSIHSPDNSAISVLYSSYQGRLFQDLSPRGQFRFRMNLALSQGNYTVGARILVNGLEADWPQGGIATMIVESGDFYKTGNKGFEGKAPMLLDGSWDVVRE